METTHHDQETPPADRETSRTEAWFEKEIQRLLPRLMATAVRLTRNRADAEDLVADAVVKALESLESLEDRDALGAWMCRIVTNTFISRKRSARANRETEVYREHPDDAGRFSLFDRLHQPFLLWQSNPEQEFLNRLLREDLEKAIDGLPDVYRVAVVLVDVQGLSYRETAETLDVPVGTVRSRLARGRSLLQEALWSQAVDAGLKEKGRNA